MISFQNQNRLKDKIMEDKTKQFLNNYLAHTQKYIMEHKNDFSSLSTIYKRFIKKEKSDSVFDYTKEIIKRMEKDKITSQTAMQIVELLTPEVQNLKKEIIKMAIPLILGLILFITFFLLLTFTRPFNLSNPFVLYWSIAMFTGLIAFCLGLFLRNKTKLSTLSKTMLFQASTAYGAAKMQGQGSFGAFRILDEMKTKQGKELQIKITQPKVMYKR